MKIKIMFDEILVCEFDKKITVHNQEWFAHLPFNEKSTEYDVKRWIESRVFPQRSGFKVLLAHIGLIKYDQIEIIKKTQGRSELDKFTIHIEE